MRRIRSSKPGLRSPRLATLLTLVVGAGLLLGSLDLHSLVHHRQNLEAEAADVATHHPEPVHLDTGRSSHELPCLACLAGLKNQGRPPESPVRPASSGGQERLSDGTSPGDVADLRYRLPLSRAPPLS